MSAAEIAAIILVSCLSVVVVRWGWKTIDWFWFRPRKLERQLRKQGLKGNRYRFLIGDMKDTARMRSQQREKPIPFDDDNDYFRRVCPFQHQLFDNFGKNAFTWLGPIPMINITEPELIREAMTKMYDFEKPKLNPLARLLVKGLIIHEGEKWAKHRKLINPAFHMEKLKLDCLDDLAWAIMHKVSKLCYRVSDAHVTRACNQPDCLDDLTWAFMQKVSKLCYCVSDTHITRACNQVLASLCDNNFVYLATSGIPCLYYGHHTGTAANLMIYVLSSRH